MERGMPIDRYYIERFLARHAEPGPAGGGIRGHVLEVGETMYVREPGAYVARMAATALPPLRRDVEKADVLDITDENPQATVIADLSSPTSSLAPETFDCIVCTQTLQLIYDAHAAVRTLARILRPGGTLLLTVPGVAQVCPPDLIASPGVTPAQYAGASLEDFWRFTSAGLARMLGDAFPGGNVEVESYGNVLTAAGFLYGLAAEDLKQRELDAKDPAYEVLIGARAVKG